MNHPIPVGPKPERRAASDSGPRTTIRLQLLVVVNSVLAVFVAVFLVSDYRRTLTDRVEEKRISLEEEAKTLLPAIIQIRHHGPAGVQGYIDTVCQQMKEDHSPGHHIIVTLGDTVFQATTHHRVSAELLSAMRLAVADDGQATYPGLAGIVVGAHQQGEATVYVSENLANLHRSVNRDSMRRLAGLIALALVGAIVVNVALSRIVTRPLNQLVATVQQIGEGHLGVQSSPFRSRELNYVAAELSSMSQLLADTDRDRRVQMAKARAIQQHLVPKSIAIPGLRIAHFLEPADEIGGDYFDALPLQDGSWICCVSDVMGHGVPAALSASMLKTLLMQAVEQFTSPAAMLSFINHRFTQVRIVGDFVSMLLVRLDPQTRTATYASAGHEPAWVVSPAGLVQKWPATGILVGIDDQANWSDMSLTLPIEHRLVMVTDGVSETRNLNGEMFGRDRLIKRVAEYANRPLDRTVERISEDVKTFREHQPQQDDLTIVLVGFEAE